MNTRTGAGRPFTFHTFLTLNLFRLLRSLFLMTIGPLTFSAYGEWRPPEVRLPADGAHPVIALPPGGLDRLQAALAKEDSPYFAEIQSLVRTGEKAVEKSLSFPPRGGLHNMWYQCDDCEAPLHTVSDTEHKCRLCGKVYSGHPYDDVIFAGRHGSNFRRMHQAAWAYALTGEEKFAKFAREVLLGYAERYLDYEYRHASLADTAYARRAGGRVFDQTLTEASYMLREIAPAYDLVYDSPSLSDEDHRRIKEGLFLPLVESIGAHRRGKSNWQSFHNAAMFWAGAVLGKTEWMERSIHDPDHGFIYQMKASLSPDGLWYEGSWSYHFYTLSALAEHARGAGHLGIDLWGHPDFKKMFALPVSYEMPDGTVPRFGNATTLRPGGFWQGNADLTEAAYHHFNDERLLSMLPKKLTRFSLLYGNEDVPREETPKLSSTVFDETGHAILRTGGEAGLAAAFTFAPYGGYHGHFDKLSFILFAHGQEVAVDRGRAASQAYRLPIHSNWYTATISHNTVLVDGENQDPVGGELLFWEAADYFTAVVASCDEAYPNASHRRMLCLTPGYLLVVDELEADEARRFDWFYHNRGEGAVGTLADQPGDLSGLGAGSDYIRDARTGTTDKPIEVTFPMKNIGARLLEAGAPETGVTIGNGPGSSVDERVPLLFLTRHGKKVRFAAVVEPVLDEAAPQVNAVAWRENERGMVIEVERGKRTDRFLLQADGKAVVRLED